MSDEQRDERIEQDRLRTAVGLLHELDRLVGRPGPLSDEAAFQELVDTRVDEAARRTGDDPAAYRRTFVRVANETGWALAEDGSNWGQRWRELQAGGRRRARWEEIRDALEDLD